MANDSITWSLTVSRMRADHARLAAVLGPDFPGSFPLVLHPAFVCSFLHRISCYFHHGGHRLVARFFWHWNLLWTGSDISPPCDIGPGLVILSPPATALMCRAGKNLTVMACSGAGSELGRPEDIGAGPGLPVLGDDVTLEPHTGILGPVRIGHRVRVPAGVVLTQDVPDDCVVEGFRPRFIPRQGVS